MNEPRRPEHTGDPDRVALDELLRAFGVDPDALDRPPATADDEAIDDTLSDDDDRDDADKDLEEPDQVDEPDDGGDAVDLDDVDEVDDDDDLLDDGDTDVEGDGADGTSPDEGGDDGTDGAVATTPPSGGGPVTVIAIDDDELPDAVYVQGSLGGPAVDDRSSVVFIDDDDTEDAIVPAGAARRMEPRLRERRIAVRRAEGRRRLRWFVVVGIVAALLVAGLAVLGSPLFSVEDVEVVGAVYTDPERLQAVVDDIEGTPTLLVDSTAAERELEAIPWVAEARVSAQFPRSATIELRERVALATFQSPDGRYRVIDRDGRVLDVLDGQPIAYMPITGPDARDLSPGAFAPPGYAAAAELVQGLTPRVRGRVESVDVSGDGSQLRLLLVDGIDVRFGAAADILTKLVRLETVLDDAVERGATIIDVSTAEVTIR